jgi:hypothetical protein
MNSSQANYQLAKEWIQHCKASHKGYCNPQLRYGVQSLPGFRLIECETRKLVKVSTHKDYVALSYVWEANSSADSLSEQVSRVIEDAIIVTKELGYNHLWIDRYCINQGNKEEKLAQVAKMDQIYADAVVTVVAVAGENPEYGLPGVSHTQRCKQPIAVMGKYHLLSLPQSPQQDILSSKWASRGWTFQEAKLSRRTIFFTDEQILF